MTTHLIPLQSSTTTSGDVKNLLEKLEGSHRDLTIVRLMANWQAGFRPFVKLADALLTKGALAPEMREICVLHIVNQRGLEYEWNEHVPMSASAGVSDEQREAIRLGNLDSETLFSDNQQVAIAFVSQMLLKGSIDGIEWDATVDKLGLDQALELIFVYAWWGGFAAVVTQVLVPLAAKAPE